jgi:putative intracellular protease/amidase
MRERRAKPLVLGAILYHQFELLDLYGPLEMFGCLHGACKIVTVADEPGAVASTQGPATLAEWSYADCPPLDLILVPGGRGTLEQLNNETLLNFLRERSATAQYTMSVCTGSAILARAGVLDGRRATSNKQLFELATQQSDQVDWVENARWVEDGPFVTASGVSAGTDMALSVISNLLGDQVAQQVADGTEYQWHRDADSDPFAKFLNAFDIDTYVSMTE